MLTTPLKRSRQVSLAVTVLAATIVLAGCSTPRDASFRSTTTGPAGPAVSPGADPGVETTEASAADEEEAGGVPLPVPEGATPPAPQAPACGSGAVSVAGPMPVEAIVRRAAELWTVDCPDVEVVVDRADGQQAFTLLCAGLVDVVGADREPGAAESEGCRESDRDLVTLPLAVEAFVAIAPPESTEPTCLTVAQVGDLFGDAAESSGDGRLPEVEAPRLVDVETLLDELTSESRTMGWLPYDLAVANAERVRIIEVSESPAADCVAPTDETVLDGTYPAARRLALHLPADSGSEGGLGPFVGFLLDEGYTEAVGAANGATGFVTLPAAEREAALDGWLAHDG